MFKTLFAAALALLYLYCQVFDIFLNNYFSKVPAPLLIGLPLIVLFREKDIRTFSLGRETFIFIIACFAYYFIGQNEFKAFAVNTIVFVTCAAYFNFFVGHNTKRFNFSVFVFFGLLTVSTLIMIANHGYGVQIDSLRTRLIGARVNQSPSGVSTAIFTFGYQLAALLGFGFVYVALKSKTFVLPVIVFLAGLIAVYYGMQRSAFIAYSLSTVVFCFVYFKTRAIPILTGTVAVSLLFFLMVLKPNSGTGNNIFNKNVENASNGENRSGLVTEDLKIYSEYPFGLVFYGKQWKDVTVNNPVFSGGLTSHNAYLMFFTYLGPIIGVLLLWLLYYPIIKIVRNPTVRIRDPNFGLLIALAFSLLAVSINSLFHNAWLINANGPTVFLYIAILHYSKTLYPLADKSKEHFYAVNSLQ